MSNVISDLIPAVEAEAEALLPHLLTVAEMEDLAVDAIPRKAEAAIFTFMQGVASFCEVAAAKVTPYEALDSTKIDPFLTLCSGMASSINAISQPPAGSAQVKNLPNLYKMVQAFLVAEGIEGTTAPTKAIVKQASVSASIAP